jgi:D-arabinose 1-dehydrogenase-like Zn-dependent alcohol dehydrogenase
LPSQRIKAAIVEPRVLGRSKHFSALTGVRSINQVFPLERAAEAYDLMMSGNARFRVVLTTGHKKRS